MSASIGTGWQVAAFFLHLAGAVSCAIAALWLARKAKAPIPHRAAMLWALATSALWCVTIAAFGTGSALAGMTEACRNIAWLAVVYRLFAADGRHQSIAPVRPPPHSMTAPPSTASPIHSSSRSASDTSIIGPMKVASSLGSPQTSVRIFSTSRRFSSS